MRDTITIGLISGLIGNMAKTLSNFFSWKSHRQDALYGHMAGSLFAKPYRTKRTGHFINGVLADGVTGALLGIPLTYLFKKTGKDNHLFKGAGWGLLLWTGIYGLGPNLGLFSLKPHKSSSNLFSFWDHLVYGLTTAEAAVQLADPNVFPEHNVSKGKSCN